jgi:hypothetical protein
MKWKHIFIKYVKDKKAFLKNEKIGIIIVKIYFDLKLFFINSKKKHLKIRKQIQVD